MSFITMTQSFGDVQEKRPVPKGNYDLVIENAEEHVSKESGKPSIKVTIAIEGHDDAPKVITYLGLPNGDDDEEKSANKMRMIKRFLIGFGIHFEDTGFAIEDFFGAKANMELVLTDPADDQQGNIYNRVNVPRLADDSKPVAGKAGTPKKS